MAAGNSRHPPSLRLRLLIVAAAVLLLALALVGAAMDRAYRAAELTALTERLESAIYLVLASLEFDASGAPAVDEGLADARLESPGSGLYAGVVTRAGEWHSPSLLGVDEPPTPGVLGRGIRVLAEPAAAESWFRMDMGVGWERADGGIIDLTVWAAEDPQRFTSAVRSFRAGLWRWLALAAGLVILAQALILVVALRPLHQVAREVSAVESGRQAELGGDYPRELQPLTVNLNALLSSERANVEQYQRALADLAHSLRTPLAVLRARLEEKSAPERDQLLAAVADLQHLVRHQLDRAARSARRTMHPPLAVEPVLARIAASIEKLYPDAGVELRVQPGLHAHIAERDLLEVAGNLVENAAKYGEGRIRVSAESGPPGRRHAGFALEVADDGPGIELDRFAELLQRGVRGDERREGYGLGLAIVQQIVDAYGGRLELKPSDLGGAQIRVILPPR